MSSVIFQNEFQLLLLWIFFIHGENLIRAIAPSRITGTKHTATWCAIVLFKHTYILCVYMDWMVSCCIGLDIVYFDIFHLCWWNSFKKKIILKQKYEFIYLKNQKSTKNSKNDWILKKNYCKLLFLCMKIQQKTVVSFREENNHIFECKKMHIKIKCFVCCAIIWFILTTCTINLGMFSTLYDFTNKKNICIE